ncbi:metal cation symporter ZIP14-like [Glandiceps talaboti]
MYQLQQLLERLSLNGQHNTNAVLEDGEHFSVNNMKAMEHPNHLGKYDVKRSYEANTGEIARTVGETVVQSSVQDIRENTCYSFVEMMQIHNLDSGAEIDRYTLSEMCPLILHQIEKEDCTVKDEENEDATEILEFEEFWSRRVRRSNSNDTDDDGPTTAQVWGFSFLSVTIINLCSLVGVVIVPFMGKKIYQHILMFLICLAVGTLSGSALLHLLPEAHGILVLDLEYCLKNLTVIGGIYLFFLTEKMMKMYVVKRKRQAKEKVKLAEEGSENEENGGIGMVQICSFKAKPGHSDHRILEPVETAAHIHEAQHAKCRGDNDMSDEIVLVVDSNGTQGIPEKVPNDNGGTDVLQENGEVAPAAGHKKCAHTELMQEGQDIATVAYMVIFGDGLHNFIDGLTIGAAFTISVISGLSICIAVICEEFPHELGDFAILLNSGMSVKKALCYNFLSACMCYLGLVCGILLGEHTEGAEWIFAVAAGMFLYISLVDMLPEINTVEENEENTQGSSQAKIFIIQNAGLLLGWGCMLVLAIFESEITI